MSVRGYFGKMLEVNLSTREFRRFQVPLEDVRLFLGGRGLGMKLLWDSLKDPGLDPLDPANPLMFLPGPFSGLPIPSSSRTSVICKSPHIAPLQSPYPHASAISHSSMGGFIGPEMRFAGYDGIIIRGKADRPVYLYILDDQAEIRDATAFWGMNTRAFQEAIKPHLEDPHFQTCFIGQAGERLNPLASIITSTSNAAGRGGSGCIMGSKNLKAIALRGTGTPNVADPEGFRDLLKKARRSFSSERKTFRETNYSTHTGLAKPIGQKAWNAMKDIAGERKTSCYFCPIPCKKGNQSLATHVLPLYENPEAKRRKIMGRMLRVADSLVLDQIISLMDDYGMDIFSAGSSIRFLQECFEQGLMDPGRANGLSLRQGNGKSILDLIHLMGKMEGLGKVASQGITPLEKTFGKPDFSFDDPTDEKIRSKNSTTQRQGGSGGSFAKSKRNLCHRYGESPSVQHQLALQDSLGACNFASPWYRDELAYHHFLTAITGAEWTADAFEKVGERIINLERHLNQREGFSRLDDRILQMPREKAQHTPEFAGQKGEQEYLDQMLDECYKARGWDPETAAPGAQKLIEMELAFVLER